MSLQFVLCVHVLKVYVSKIFEISWEKKRSGLTLRSWLLLCMDFSLSLPFALSLGTQQRNWILNSGHVQLCWALLFWFKQNPKHRRYLSFKGGTHGWDSVLFLFLSRNSRCEEKYVAKLGQYIPVKRINYPMRLRNSWSRMRDLGKLFIESLVRETF